jgi:hypothetical protein
MLILFSELASFFGHKIYFRNRRPKSKEKHIFFFNLGLPLLIQIQLLPGVFEIQKNPKMVSPLYSNDNKKRLKNKARCAPAGNRMGFCAGLIVVRLLSLKTRGRDVVGTGSGDSKTARTFSDLVGRDGSASSLK